MWLVSSAEDYFSIHPDPAFERSCMEKFARLLDELETLHRHPCGLYWSDDDRDGMEFSISGPGIRPTVNSYLYGDCMALSRMAAKYGMTDISERCRSEALRIREAMDRMLWRDGFYRTIPCAAGEPIPDSIPDSHDVRELIGYLPWYFGMPDRDKDEVFRLLTDRSCFLAPFGITTADQSHPRFLFEHPHECLWNGYVWPYAVSQTLTAMARMLHENPDAPVSKEDYFLLLSQYARSHTRTDDQGRQLPWIDEVVHPLTGEWSARAVLKARHWDPALGGYERGKDYNHSTFCDLILSGLLGIRIQDGRVTADPLIPDHWDYFCVSNLTTENHTVLFDRTGEHYGMGKGLQIF